MKKGCFITFEGMDGGGKSTQMALLCTHLRKKGFEVVISREPGGCKISERIRELVLDPCNQEMTGETEALLYAAARAQHVREVIAPALKSGKIVLCDRFIHSSLAYQGYGRRLGIEKVMQMNQMALGGLWPDLTFYLYLDPEKGLQRNNQGGKAKDRLEMEQADFRQRVRQGFEDLAAKDKTMVCIDAGGGVEHIHQLICTAAEKLF